MAARMEDPKIAGRVDDAGAVGIGAPLVGVEAGTLDDAMNEAAGAGGAPQFALVDEDIHLDGRSEGGGSGAETPTGWEQTVIAPGGACADDAAGHEGSSIVEGYEWARSERSD